MASISTYRLPPKAFPRYEYFSKYVTKLTHRSNSMIKKCGITRLPAVPSFKDVTIYIQHQPRQSLLTTDQLVIKKTDRTGSPEVNSVEEFQKKFDEDVDYRNGVFVISGEELRKTGDLPEYSGKLVVVIEKNKGAIPRYNIPGTSELVEHCIAEDFAETLSLLLEIFVFSFLKDRAEVLQCFTEAAFFDFTSVSRSVTAKLKKPLHRELSEESSVKQSTEFGSIKTWAETRSRVWESEIRNIYSKMPKEYRDQLMERKGETSNAEIKHHLLEDTGPVYSAGSGRESVSPTIDRRDTWSARDRLGEEVDLLWDLGKRLTDIDTLDKRMRRHFTELQRNQQTNRDLVGEIFATYKRSKVPEPQRPQINMDFPKLEEEVAAELLAAGATGCGYRLDTLHVHIEPTKPEGEVKKVLKKYDINNYILKSEAVEIVPFSGIEVGAALQNDAKDQIRTGTLGGFAQNSNKMYVLLARHFAQTTGGDIFLKRETGDPIKIARVLKAQKQGPLDIAAAELNESGMEVYSRRFKNSSGDYSNSRLFDFKREDLDRLRYLPVYFWGAASRPGEGKVTIPEYYMRNMGRLVVIEDMPHIDDYDDEKERSIYDRTESINNVKVRKRFAKKGDSGAIICADDIDGQYVQVISMLMGSKYSYEVENNPEKAQEYVAFRLQSGLHQLNQEHGGTFEIC